MADEFRDAHQPYEVKETSSLSLSSSAEEAASKSVTKSHVFEDPDTAEYYRQLYFKNSFEGRHHFDPKFEWTESEERMVLRKTELRVVCVAFFLFFALDIDRGNLSNALSDNFLTELNLSTNDYNLGNTVNLICFLCAEIPSQLISKKIGADIWVPSQMVLWSIVAMSQALIKNRTGFLATRAMLGMLQGGFIPDLCLWMSYFYTSKELPMRLSLFYIANPLSGVICSLLGFGILHLDGTNGIQGWRWLFLLEGLFTLLVGAAAFFLMPPSAVQTKTWYRKNGWYTDREEKIMINRILRDDPSKGDMNNRQAVSFKNLWGTIFDWDLLPIYSIRIFGDIGVSPVGTYLTLNLRKLGFSTFNTNLLTIPTNMLAIFTMLALTWFSDRFKRYGNSIANYIQTIWVLPFLFLLRFWPGAALDSEGQVWPTYVLLTLVLAYPCAEPITITWCSVNSNAVRSRAVSAALVNIFSQLANVASANIYRDDDAPLYHRGNEQLIYIAFAQLVQITLTIFYYRWRNARREKVWAAMSPEERQDYVLNTKDSGNKRLDFRFSY
jgi:sugar phosphate permease